MNKLVLCHRLHHQHALLSQMTQHFWNVDVDIVVDAVEENVAQDGDARSADAGRAVDQNGRVSTFGSGFW